MGRNATVAHAVVTGTPARTRQVLEHVEQHYSEQYIRKMFMDYTRRILDMALDVAEFADERAQHRESESNRDRLGALQRTATYAAYRSSYRARRATMAIRKIDVERQLNKLCIRSSLTAQETYTIYKDFISAVTTEAQIAEFLSYLPGLQTDRDSGILFPIAVPLLHPSTNVRRAAAHLLQRLMKTPVRVRSAAVVRAPAAARLTRATVGRRWGATPSKH